MPSFVNRGPSSAGLTGLHEIQIDGQVRLPTNAVSPLVAVSDNTERSLDGWVECIKEQWQESQVDDIISRHGAILLRGLPIENARDFSKLLHAFGWSPHIDVGNPVNRVIHAPNVANANEGPPTLYIPAHSEFGISNMFPSRICFWVMAAPEAGGQTPINSGAWLYERLASEAPEFIRELIEKGVRYTVHHPASKVSLDANGNGILSAWGSRVLATDDADTIKTKVEAEIRSISPETTWQWLPDGGLYTFQRVPAVRWHPTLQTPVIFSALASYYAGAIYRGTLDPPHLDSEGLYKPPPLFGDDSPIPLKYLELLERITCEIRTDIKWEKHDVFIIDNIGTQHSRRPWTKGERRILASLWDSGPEKLARKIEG